MKIKKIAIGFLVFLLAHLNVHAEEPMYLECNITGKYLNGDSFIENPLVAISENLIDISNSNHFPMLEAVNVTDERYLAILEVNDGKYANGITYSEKTVVEINRLARTIFVNDSIKNSDNTSDGFTATGRCIKPKSKLPKKK